MNNYQKIFGSSLFAVILLSSLSISSISAEPRNYTIMEEGELPQKCSCKCHFGGAVSCPGCKDNHDNLIKCEHCKKD